MRQHRTIEDAFASALREFDDSTAIRILRSPGFGRAHYASILREVFHYAKEDPQLQALATVYLRGSDREQVRTFLRHAIAEIGHDRLALDDLHVLGEDPSSVATSNPLPETIALTAYPFYQMQYRAAVGYIGYLYFLEHMPTRIGAQYAAALRGAGIPESAMRFLSEHTTVDVGHNRLMEGYLANLVRTEDDCAEVVYAMRVTGRLYASMLLAAIRRAESQETFGHNPIEAARTTPAVA